MRWKGCQPHTFLALLVPPPPPTHTHPTPPHTHSISFATAAAAKKQKRRLRSPQTPSPLGGAPGPVPLAPSQRGGPQPGRGWGQRGAAAWWEEEQGGPEPGEVGRVGSRHYGRKDSREKHEALAGDVTRWHERLLRTLHTHIPPPPPTHPSCSLPPANPEQHRDTNRTHPPTPQPQPHCNRVLCPCPLCRLCMTPTPPTHGPLTHPHTHPATPTPNPSTCLGKVLCAAGLLPGGGGARSALRCDRPGGGGGLQ